MFGWKKPTRPLPESVSALKRIPQKQYNFKHVLVQEAPVSAPIVLWNLIDFGHVHWMHRKTYHHCKIVARKGHLNLVEFGVNQFFFLKLPISFKYLMWHEVVSPTLVRHISRSPWGSYTRVEVRLEEYLKDGRKHTRLHHCFYANFPKFVLPFTWVLTKYIEAWSGILWKEDYGMLVRRQKVLDAGFKDHSSHVETEVFAEEGFSGTFLESAFSHAGETAVPLPV